MQPLNNPFEPLRGKILLKKFSCVFLPASFIPASVIIASVCIQYKYVYVYISIFIMWVYNIFKSTQWHFHQDNAPVHNSILVTDYLTKMGIKTVPQRPYSPDLVLCDFWLFPKLRGCRYETIEEMKEVVTNDLRNYETLEPNFYQLFMAKEAIWVSNSIFYSVILIDFRTT